MLQLTAMKSLALAGCLLLWALPALAQLPQRDLTIELRQVDEGAGTGYSVSTQPLGRLMTPQQVQVRNGEKALLRVDQSIPMQWVQSASRQNASQNATMAASAASLTVSGSNTGGSVKTALTWMDSGQAITLRPRWPGAKQLVTVEVEVQTSNVGERTGAELPSQSRSHVATTVSAALGQWVTIAATGASAQSGSYSSEASNDTRRLLQLRVQAP